MKITIDELKMALFESWNYDTAFGEWTPKCLSLNQCAVTAMIVQDYFGGDLLRCECDDGDSHYWNKLPNGQEIDLTKEQFLYSGVVPFKHKAVIRDREYVESFEETMFRYKILSNRVSENLG
jgi:hypothetical protein